VDPTSWTPADVNHNEVLGSCVSCHDGNSAIGQPGNHINTTNQCQACHNTVSFRPVDRVDHGEVNGSCVSCHDGSIAEGKDEHSGFNTTDNCDACHNTNSFGSINMDHGEALPRCDDCHNLNNPIAGADRPPNDTRHNDAAAAGDDCDACHNTNDFD